MSHCQKCHGQRKGCTWVEAKKRGASAKASTAPGSVAATSMAGPAPPHVDLTSGRTTKRQKRQDSPEVSSGPHRASTSQQVEVLVSPRPRARPKPLATTSVSTSPSSPTFSFSPFNPPSEISSTLGPPPSAITTSRSVPDFTSQSHQLEVTLLRSRLEAANTLLVREQEQYQRELQTIQAQFEQEREVYREYIRGLERGSHRQ